MGIERTLVEREGRDFCELPRETITSRKSRKNPRRQKRMLPVQKLFETCKDVFASSGTGIVPPPQDIEKLRSVLDAIKPEDVGLKPDMSYFRANSPQRRPRITWSNSSQRRPRIKWTNSSQRRPRITYLHIYECEKFSMGIFCLPPSGVIPLHNHPGMTVFSKLLFGTMHIKSYDWVVDLPPDSKTIVAPSGSQAPEMRLAKIKVDADFTAPCNPSILYPTDGGNLHCFTAVTACAVLDVLGPPYSDPDDRHCTYYFNYPFSNFPVDGISIPEEEREAYEWLQERENVDDIEVAGEKYSGPKIVES